MEIFWLRTSPLEDSDNLPDPAVLAREIVESLETALEQFRGIEDELEEGNDASLPISLLLVRLSCSEKL